DRPGRNCEMGTELLRLQKCTFGELAAGEPARKPEVVLDQGGGAGLTAARDRVEHGRQESIARPVDRRGEAGRPRADDDDIVGRGRSRDITAAEPERAGELRVRRVSEHLTGTDQDNRRVLRCDPKLLQVAIGVRVTLELDPEVRDAATPGELTEAVRVRRIARTDDADAGTLLSDPFPAPEPQLQDPI